LDNNDLLLDDKLDGNAGADGVDDLEDDLLI